MLSATAKAVVSSGTKFDMRQQTPGFPGLGLELKTKDAERFAVRG